MEPEKLHPMIRVNQAGEYGASRIYAGQLAILKNDPCAPLLQHMKDQEQVHLDTFNELMVKNHVRPTILSPLWHLAGYALGASTALLGKEAAMACTVAVEEVIDEHYQGQLRELEQQGSETEALRETIEKFRQEELEHKNCGLNEGALDAPAYGPLTFAVRQASKLAIWLSKRI